LKGFELEEFEVAFEEAIKRTFRKKKNLVDLNIRAFHEGHNSVETRNV
jgi:Pyruvate/2-oxoacid:ferredoxin oxidoreductase gamma subunit